MDGRTVTAPNNAKVGHNPSCGTANVVHRVALQPKDRSDTATDKEVRGTHQQQNNLSAPTSNELTKEKEEISGPRVPTGRQHAGWTPNRR